MNAGCYKIVFSKRLGALVAVGEHTCGQGKTAGTGIRTATTSSQSFVGALKTGLAAVALLAAGTCAAAGLAPLATNALPTGASVNSGNVAISTQGAAMTIQQTTNKASVNWNAFNIGSGASVNVQQNNANAVLLNRVVGNDPSQIFGKLTANGQVVLINPNGIVFGKDGSVAASAFTASTFGISEQDFANGKYNYTRNGSTAGVTVQAGATLSTSAPGGYVALIGSSVDNQGAISTQGGSVVMAAGQDVALPTALTSNVSVPLSGKVRLELLPSTINSMVANSGTITTEGGQVLMQAAALSDAVASVTHTGTIDTSGTQGGAVTLQADQGVIRVSGSIKANSTDTAHAGGDVVIGRDLETGALAKTTDVSGAKLESQGGFVETSGEYLKTDGISVKAKDWLLDPSDITISSATNSNVTGTSPAAITPNGVTGTSSIVSVNTIQTAINSGTNVTIKTTNASNTTGAGNITIANALTFNNQGGTDATLSLIADNGITQNSGASITTNAASTKLVNVNMTANGNYQGNTAASASSQGIALNSTINTNGTVTVTGTSNNTGGVSGVQFGVSAGITTKGTVQVTGTSTVGTGYGVGLNNTLIDAGTTGDVSIIGTSSGNHGIYNHYSGVANWNMKLVGRDVILNGTSSGAGASGFYSFIGQSAGNIIIAERDISVTGTTNSSTTGSGLLFTKTNWQTYVNSYTAKGSITFTGTSTAATNTDAAVYLSGIQAKTTSSGNISVNANTKNAGVDAIKIFSNPVSTPQGYQGGATSLVSTSGDVKIQSNQGGIFLSDGVPHSVTPTTISGRNISIDNTGGSIDASTGVITRGTGQGSSGISISDSRAFNATGNINLYGAGTSGNGVTISGAATLSAANINITGENTNATAGNAAINISNANSKLTSTAATTLTSAGVGSGTSLVEAGDIAVGTQLKVTTPAAGTISGLISGAGSLLKRGAGQTKLTAYNGTTYGTNTFTGGTTISQGSILLGNGNGSYNNTAGAGAITLGDANTGNSDVGLWIEKGKDGTQGSLSRNISVTNNGTGTATIGGANGTGTGWTIITGTIDLNRNVTFADMTNDRLGLDGQITGTGNITIAGTGSGNGPRISMGSAKTFTGDVTINSGVKLQAGAANLFNSSTNVLANGNFDMNGTSQAINSLNGASTGQVTSGGTLTVGSDNGGGAFAGGISGGTKLIKNGTGTQILTGNNTYFGGTNVAAGTLQIGDGTNNGLIGAGAVDIGTGATLNFNVKSSGVNYVSSNTFTGGGIFKKTGAGGLTWGGGVANFSLGAGALIDVQQGILTGAANANDVWANNKASLNVASGAIFAGVEGNIMVDALTGAGAVTSGYPGYAYGLTVGVNGGSGTFAGSIQDANGKSANLTKVGTGTQILTGNNTYSGTTTISAGVLQVGDGGTTGNLGTGAVTDNASLVFNRSNSLTVANTISGAGTLTQAGSGTTILTTNNSYAGTTTVSNGTLQVGDGGTTGNLGTGAVTDNASLVFNRSNSLTVTNAISGAGTLTQAGSGTTILTANNYYAGTTTVSNGTLQVGNGGTTGTLGAGDVALSNSANLSYSRSTSTTIANNISGAGNVSVNITGASSDLTVDRTINITNGTVNLVTDGNLSVKQAISTTNATNSAVFLEAGKSTAAGTSSGGDVTLSGSGSVTANSGLITFMTGSIVDSIGLGVSAGNNRYNSDETTKSYTSALGSTGRYAIYREAPTLTATFNNASKTYDGLAYAGNNGVSAYTGFVNGDTNGLVGSITTTGTAQGEKNAGTYTINGNALSGLGYKVVYTAGTLTVNKANLILSGTRVYDASQTFAGQYLTATGVNGETFTVTGSGDATNLANKNVQTAQALSSVTGIALGSSSNGGLVDNYNALSTTASSVSVTAKAATVTGTATNVTYNGGTQTQQAVSASGFIAGDAITITGQASGKDAGSYASSLSVGGGDASNYNVTIDNASLVIAKAGLTATGNSSSVTYNGSNQSVAGFTVSGLQGSDTVINLSSIVASGATGKNAGSYTNTVTAGTETNYTVTTTNGSLDIAKANLVLSGTRVYDASQTFAGQYLTATGVNGETFTVTGSGDATNLNTKNVQANQKLSSVTGLSLSGSNNGALSGNYNAISAAGSSVSVTAKNATITGTTTNLTYNGTSQSQNAAVLAGFVDADVSSGTIGATGLATGRNAGTYTSNLSVTGTDAANYNVTVTNKDLVIAKKDASITGTTTNVTYNGTSQSQNAAVLAGFVDADVSNGTVGATGLATGRNAGSYTSNLSATGTDAANYNVTVTNANLVVGKKAASITGTATNVTYNGTSQSQNAAVLAGFVDADVSNGTVGATGLATGRNAGTYASNLSATGKDKDNYNVTVTNKDLVITKKFITLDGIISANKTYDGTTTANITAGAITTGVANETLAISGKGTFSDKNAAEGKTVTVVDVTTLTKTNSTGDWNNYTLSTTGSITTKANIDKRNVTLDSITAASKVYDGTDAAVITSGSITTGVGNETLAISGQGKFADAAPGTNKVVTVADVKTLTKSNGSGDWRNYNLSTTGSKTTAAAITAIPPLPVAPTPSPASASSTSARVKVPVGSSNPFQLASVEDLVDDTCSASNLESCFCEASSANDEVLICYEKRGSK